MKRLVPFDPTQNQRLKNPFWFLLSLVILIPGSFLKGGAFLASYDHLYFSFVTLSTLGYGDIIPNNNAGEALAILIALVGQIYLTLVVAIFVGKFLTHSGQK